MKRTPVVAGKFYSANKHALQKQLASYVSSTTKKKALACIMPHAGYVYSGAIATQTAANIDIPEHIVLIGPNHTGIGSPFSIVSEGKWQTPFGSIDINTQLAESLKTNCSLIKEDENAHIYEHSLEVQLPILQFVKQDTFDFIPLVAMATNKDDYQAIALALVQTISELKLSENTLIIASSDMTHYESQKSAQEKDNLALEAILNLDEDLLLKRVTQHNISMCGFVPVAITIMACKKLGAHNAQLIRYQTSGDISGNYDSVVGYAGVMITK